MKFTEFLVEFTPQSWMITNPDEIKKWLNRYELYENNDVMIASDGTTNAKSIYFSKNKLRFVNGGMVLPIQFGKCEYFSIDDCRLSTLKGSPRIVTGDFTAVGNLITDLDGAPEEIGSSCNISKNPNLTSLTGIHKHIKYIGYDLIISGTIKSSILGILMIKNIKKVVLWDPSNISKLDDMVAAVQILNKHNKGNRDILECQEEMINAGLKEYAKI